MNPPIPNEWAWHIAAEEGDRILAEHAAKRRQDPDWHPPCSAQDLERARLDALQAIVRPQDMPSPYAVARHLVEADPDAALALVRAYVAHGSPYFGSYRVADDGNAVILRGLGLIGSVGKERRAWFRVGAFGLAVRRILIADPMEEDVDGEV